MRPVSLKVLFCGSLLVSAIAPCYIAYIIATVGGDNVSNDFLAYAPLLGQILDGGYNWANIFRDTFYKGASATITFMAHYLDAVFFRSSVRVELFAGLALTLARFALLYQALSRQFSDKERLIFMPLLSALVFSCSQISLFIYPDASLPMGLCLFGASLGLWGLIVLTEKKPAALTTMLTGGLIAAYSWGTGPLSWAIFLLALILLGYRRCWHYAVWFSGAALSALPYLMAFRSGADKSTAVISPHLVVSWFNFHFILEALGRPFANNIGTHAEHLTDAKIAGISALILVGFGLIIYLRSKAVDRLRLTPGLLVTALGLVSIWQIGVVRVLVTSWYSAISMMVWIGLLGLAFALLGKNGSDDSNIAPKLQFASKCLALAIVALISVSFLRTNLTYEDKTDLLWGRAPASAAAIRNYKTAPTYADAYVFLWGTGNPGLLEFLATPLARHQLSVFAPHQEWLLQGDYLFDSVKTSLSATARPYWLDGGVRRPWSHYKQLDLALPPETDMEWQISLPAETRSALFKSSFRGGPQNAGGKPAMYTIRVKKSDTIAQSIAGPADSKNSWRPISIDLSAFKGETISIEIKSQNTSQDVVFMHPTIELQLDEIAKRVEPTGQQQAVSQPGHGKNQYFPENTGYNPKFPGLNKSEKDLQISPLVLKKGTAEAADASPPTWHISNKGGNVELRWKGSDSISIRDFSKICFAAAASENWAPRVVQIDLYVSGNNKPITAAVPILGDSKTHSYTYDLKLLELPADATVTALTIRLEPDRATIGSTLDLSELRLLPHP